MYARYHQLFILNSISSFYKELKQFFFSAFSKNQNNLCFIGQYLRCYTQTLLLCNALSTASEAPGSLLDSQCPIPLAQMHKVNGIAGIVSTLNSVLLESGALTQWVASLSAQLLSLSILIVLLNCFQTPKAALWQTNDLLK